LVAFSAWSPKDASLGRFKSLLRGCRQVAGNFPSSCVPERLRPRLPVLYIPPFPFPEARRKSGPRPCPRFPLHVPFTCCLRLVGGGWVTTFRPSWPSPLPDIRRPGCLAGSTKFSPPDEEKILSSPSLASAPRRVQHFFFSFVVMVPSPRK